MKSFLKYTLATIVGIIITSLIGFLLMLGIVGALISMTEEKPAVVKPNSVLKITLDNEIVDRTSNNPFKNFNWTTMESEPSVGLNDILRNIKKAKSDKKIKGIYLEVDAIPAGIATIQEVREALLDFKECGKFILAYSDMYTQGAYYLASVADKIYLTPTGLVEFKGLSAELMFFKGTLEKLGIEPQIIRHGKFKSAIEPLILDKMSEANREQTMTYMQSIWNHLLEGISDQRGVSVDDLNKIADSMLITDAALAEKYKLIDGQRYRDEVIAELKELTGTNEKKQDVNYIGLAKYTNAPDSAKTKELIKDKIAVIYATGQIDIGKGDEESIGSDGLSETIRKARLDSTVKAVVLRVNSPGGSALASEVIWREMVLTKEKKPVIVSMGDVAASGGYYISCPADMILASQNTITGSIGVFGVLWNSQELLNETLGITIDVAKTNQHADIGSAFRPMTLSERSVIQKEVEDIYDVFVGHVSAGRNMTTAEVDSIGQGRVWSGTNAKEIGLIDEFGGMTKAVEVAKEKAGLDTYRLVELPEQEDPFQKIIKEMMGDEKALLKKHLGIGYKYIRHLKDV
ncbi:MAG: signal peptide peptidase SppA, partial [Bacteroidetes bacterium]|nr:signal peptide peptidase SppA [Bacteroidota bacterium]